jgi:hypothetical protein
MTNDDRQKARAIFGSLEAVAPAAQGQDAGIVCGADIIALRKIEVESTDYAQREYAATQEQTASSSGQENSLK